jgi:hypothetical protein
MKFIHFGCWNRGGCQLDTVSAGQVSDFTRVVSSIHENLEGIEFISVAGDNYYPDKEKKKDKGEKKEKGDKEKGDKEKDKGEKKEKGDKGEKKKILVNEDLETGFKCLMDLDVDKYIVLGNHELDDKITQMKTSKSSNNARNVTDDNKCIIITKQLELVKGKPKVEFYGDNILSKYDSSSKTLLIMFDTTIYEMPIQMQIKETCYKELGITKDLKENANIGDLQIKQEQMINTCITDYSKKGINNLVLVGHHPIIGIKEKKGGKNIDISNGLILYLTKNIDLFLDKKVYYLCADVHLYQSGHIILGGYDDPNKKLIIEQHIVGTGGAHKDTVFDDKVTQTHITDNDKRVTIEYVINDNIKDNISTNGYLVCETTLEEMKCKFIDVGPGEENGAQNGGKRLSINKKHTQKHTQKHIAKKKLTKNKVRKLIKS